jgi:hypothetical protein
MTREEFNEALSQIKPQFPFGSLMPVITVTKGSLAVAILDALNLSEEYRKDLKTMLDAAEKRQDVKNPSLLLEYQSERRTVDDRIITGHVLIKLDLYRKNGLLRGMAVFAFPKAGYDLVARKFLGGLFDRFKAEIMQSPGAEMMDWPIEE